MSLLGDQPQRMAREKLLLEALARAESWFSLHAWSSIAAGGLEVQFTLRLANGCFDGVLTYPCLFPDVPAYVRPLRKGESWSSHQYEGSGVLCLERGPDNWDSSVTGVDLIRSAHKLLWGEIIHYIKPELGPVPSRHRLTQGQELRSESSRFLVTAEFADKLASLPAGSQWPMSTMKARRGDEEVTVATALGVKGTERLASVPLLSQVDMGCGVIASIRAAATSKVGTATELAALIDVKPEAVEQLYGMTVVICGTDSNPRAFSVSLQGQITELAVVADGPRDDVQRRPASYARLSKITVSIVGLGSLGSKIAVALARSGVRRFRLIDTDVLLPSNLVRNELDWRDVGFSKVNSVAERIQYVAPGAVVNTSAVEVGGQENPFVAAKISEVIGSADLVIDATANANAFVNLAAVCRRKAVALVWGEVFAGGVGALMARSRPGRDADALGIRRHVFGVMETMAPALPIATVPYGLIESDEVLVAGDPAVSQLAASMTRFAIDAVCGGDSPDFPVAAYLLGFKKGWEFKAPFETIPIECPLATEPAPSQPLSRKEADALAKLSAIAQRSADAAVDDPR